MCDFSRVSAWFCDEKISLKKSCFYLYIRRSDVDYWSKTYFGLGIYQRISTRLVSIIDRYIEEHKGKYQVYAAPFAVYLDERSNTYLFAVI